MMNETGSYPGQAWLWLYSFWYQIPQFNSDNPDDYLTSHADAIIFYIMAVLSLGLLLLPFIPGLKSIPRWIPLHRLIWRDYYRQQPIGTSGAGGGDSSNESGRQVLRLDGLSICGGLEGSSPDRMETDATAADAAPLLSGPRMSSVRKVACRCSACCRTTRSSEDT